MNYDIQIDMYKEELSRCKDKMNRYKNKALNLQRKIREMEFANKKPINWWYIRQRIKCLFGIHDWEYGLDHWTGEYYKIQEPHHMQRRCEICGKYEHRDPMPPDGFLTDWKS